MLREIITNINCDECPCDEHEVFCFMGTFSECELHLIEEVGLNLDEKIAEIMTGVPFGYFNYDDDEWLFQVKVMVDCGLCYVYYITDMNTEILKAIYKENN